MSSTVVIDGRPRRLRLTLGALSRLEAALGAGDFQALSARLAAPRAGDLVEILAALVDEPGLDAEALARADVDPAEAARAVAAAFGALGDGAKKRSGGSPGETGSSTECA